MTLLFITVNMENKNICIHRERERERIYCGMTENKRVRIKKKRREEGEREGGRGDNNLEGKLVRGRTSCLGSVLGNAP